MMDILQLKLVKTISRYRLPDIAKAKPPTTARARR